MLKKDPQGYHNLLVYQKAQDLFKVCVKVTGKIKNQTKTLQALADQMDRSMRSVKQNIVEGWKRNTTLEYFNFLGFSIGSLAELAEDTDDIIEGRYKELMCLKGIMGVKGSKLSPVNQTLSTLIPFDPLFPFNPFRPFDPLIPYLQFQ